MPITVKTKPRVRIRYDEMEAYIMLPEPEAGEKYTISNLMQVLGENEVRAGIDQDKLLDMINNSLYEVEVPVAKGTSVVDGTDGYYEYNFNTNVDKKPKILPDGSVDYWSVNSIEEVREGQIIAVYHPAVQGKDGVNVKGQLLQAKRGREQGQLRGKGFTRSDDNVTYIASVDGKIEMQNDRIVIQQVHEIQGNADLTIGNIDFRGDVIVHGNVESGVNIKATGTITVDGVVEACTLEAGKDIILRNGMQGGNKSFVRTKGNVTARFFEFTRIECDGQLQTDVLLDCVVRCKSRIIVNGTKGKIIGGDIRAIEGVEVYTLGNDVEKRTELTVGAEIGVCAQLHTLEKNIQTAQENLAKIEVGLGQFDKLEAEKGVSYANDPRRIALLRLKIKDTANLANDQTEAKKLRILLERSKGASVSVIRGVHPGVIIYIDELKFRVKNYAESITFIKQTDKIVARPYYGNVD